MPPAIIMVPGATQKSEHYAPLATILTSRGFDTYPLTLPSVDRCESVKDFTEDVDLIHMKVSSLVDEGRDIIVVMHSYGGMPGSQALKGLGKRERAGQGKPGGVIRLVYIAAWVIDEGETMPGAGDLENMKSRPGYDAEKHTINLSKEAALTRFFHDLPQEQAESFSEMLGGHSVGALWSTQTYCAWKDIPSAYIMAEQDRVIYPQKQEELVAKAQEQEPKAFDVVERLACGHEPMLSETEKVAAMIESLSTLSNEW